LLLSTSNRFPSGLSNTSGLVGKRLMLHPYVTVLGTYEENLESWVGPFGAPIVSSAFAETDEARGFIRGSHWELLPGGPPLQVLTMAGHGGMSLADGWGPKIHDLMREVFGRSFAWGFTAEDLPDEENRITLHESLTDSDGIPAPRI